MYDSVKGVGLPRHGVIVLLVFWIGLFAAVPVAAQGEGLAQPNRLEAELVELGLENVLVGVRGDALVVAYENRRYRNEARALQEVLMRAARQAGGLRRLTLVPQRRGLALMEVSVDVEAVEAFMAGDLPKDVFARRIEVDTRVRALRGVRQSKTNRTRFKLDAVINPDFAAEFGNFVDPISMRVGLVPELRTSLWRGMQLRGQLVVPVYNELLTDEQRVRPGLIALSQTVRLPRSIFVAGTVGYFVPNRYGGQLEVEKYVAGGRLVVGGRVGRTGYAEYWGRTWFYDDLNETTYQASLRWYLLPAYDLHVHLEAGRYLFDDAGAQFGVSRAFGEVEVGFRGMLTNEGENAVLSITVPLAGTRYMKPRTVRVRQASYFEWEYRYRRLQRGARMYATGSDVASLWRRLPPASVARRVADLPGWRAE